MGKLDFGLMMGMVSLWRSIEGYSSRQSDPNRLSNPARRSHLHAPFNQLNPVIHEGWATLDRQRSWMWAREKSDLGSITVTVDCCV